MNEVLEILKNAGAILTNDHFVGTSGAHFDTYINKDFLYPHTGETSRIGELFAEKYKDQNIEVVVGPAMGGVILSQWTAHHLSKITGKEVLGIYTEKSEGVGQIFTRGYDQFVKGKRVLVVEDIITTGGSIEKTMQVVKDAGGDLVAACAMVKKTKDLDFESLAELFVETHEAEKCPLCKNNVPINTEIGHGKKFLATVSSGVPPTAVKSHKK